MVSPARTSRSSSLHTPPIHTARLTPPFMASANRISGIARSSSSATHASRSEDCRA